MTAATATCPHSLRPAATTRQQCLLRCPVGDTVGRRGRCGAASRPRAAQVAGPTKPPTGSLFHAGTTHRSRFSTKDAVHCTPVVPPLGEPPLQRSHIRASAPPIEGGPRSWASSRQTTQHENQGQQCDSKRTSQQLISPHPQCVQLQGLAMS